MKSLLSISYNSDASKSRATEFAKTHGYPCVADTEVTTTLKLHYTDDKVELCDLEKEFCIDIDFIAGNLAHRQQYGGGRGQSIAKAIGLKQGLAPPSVLDATAGLAKDAYVLACLGCRLTLLERSPVIVELINDAIERAKENEHFQKIIDRGFNVIANSSIDYLTELFQKSKDNLAKKRLPEDIYPDVIYPDVIYPDVIYPDVIYPDVIYPDVIYPDVIYLDPMYPDRKKSASVKKNMQILQTLLGKDEDTEELLNIALKVAKKRVVVKRPKGAENLSSIKPTYQVNSKKTRYDVYIIKS